MKLLIMLLLLSVMAQAEVSLLVHLLSKHNNKTNEWGQKFNEENYGLGIQYDNYKEDPIYITASLNVINDSYKHLMYTGTVGLNVMVYDKNYFKISIGTELGAAYKNRIKVKKGKQTFRYEVLPIVLVPKISLGYKNVSIILTHVPEMTYRGSKIEGVTLLSLGYRI